MAADLECVARAGPPTLDASATRVELLRRQLHARLLGNEQLARLGRFEVLHTLGSGGMGTVFAGRDPQLQRRVALKLLRVNAPTDTLGREARALAKLAHPGIVEVYDVGREDDRVFVAMELVEGETVAAWLESKPARTEIVRAFLAVGEALAAAHRAGVVHGDIKPSNMLRRVDGRIKIIDFGLSRILERADRSLVTDGSREDTSATGGGTWGFVAPEKLQREPDSARSDQFSFCVCMAVALCGELPFSGSDTAELSASVLAGPRWPSHRRIPSALRRALERGLAPDAAQRWPSMDALLDRIRPHAVPRRRWPWLLGAAAIAGIVGWATPHTAASDGAIDCDRADGTVRAIWGATQRSELEQVLASPSAAVRIVDRLDAYADEIAKMRRDACAATSHGGDSALVDARSTCLSRRERALADAIATADASPSRRLEAVLVRRVHALPRVEPCDDPAYLEAAIPPPAGADLRKRADALTQRLDELRTHLRARDHATGLPLADAALRDAEALGYAPLVVRAHNDLGVMHQLAGHMADARHHFETAYFGAREQRMEVQALQTASNLVALCDDEADYDEALRWERHAAALLDDAPDAVVASKLHHNVAIVLQKLGRNEEARERLERSLAIRSEQLGPDHPITLDAVFELGTVAMAQGRLEDATTAFEQTSRGWEAAFGPQHPDLANVHNNLGNVLAMQDRPKQAAARYEQAIEIRERTLGPDHPALGGALANLARVRSTLGQHQAAREAAERSLSIRRTAFGDAHPAVASSWLVAGQIAHAQGRLHDAKTLLAEALHAWAETFDDTHPPLRETLLEAGEVALQMGELDTACSYAERLLDARTDEDAADAQWLLARASLAKRPRRALELAGAAERRFRDDGRTGDAQEIRTWLETSAP